MAVGACRRAGPCWAAWAARHRPGWADCDPYRTTPCSGWASGAWALRPSETTASWRSPETCARWAGCARTWRCAVEMPWVLLCCLNRLAHVAHDLPPQLRVDVGQAVLDDDHDRAHGVLGLLGHALGLGRLGVLLKLVD